MAPVAVTMPVPLLIMHGGKFNQLGDGCNEQHDEVSE